MSLLIIRWFPLQYINQREILFKERTIYIGFIFNFKCTTSPKYDVKSLIFHSFRPNKGRSEITTGVRFKDISSINRCVSWPSGHCHGIRGNAQMVNASDCLPFRFPKGSSHRKAERMPQVRTSKCCFNLLFSRELEGTTTTWRR